MMTKWSYLIVLFCFLAFVSEAQQTFYMSNGLINECEGILKDSEENQDFPGYYNHNEHFILTICVDNPGDFELFFTEFHTEEGFDFLNIYSGVGTGGTLIASYDGFGIPPAITIQDVTCITIEFISDDNVTEFGWTMFWEVTVEEPDAPRMQLASPYSCEETDMTIILTDSVICDSISIANFDIVGTGPVGIASIDPAFCHNGKTNRLNVTLAPPITVGGNYQLRLITYIEDACGEVFELISVLNINVDDCPMVVFLTADSVCVGDCFQVRADVFGGDGNYNFQWTPTAPNSDVVEICIEPGESISVTVSDGSGASESETITPGFYPIPRILNLPGDTICRGHPTFNLQASSPGGRWTGIGVHPNNALNGRYESWRANANNANPDIITYTDLNGCVADTTMVVLYITAGTHDGACTGAPAFQVSGGQPGGGTWSGTGISPDGVFDLTVQGTYSVTYMAPNGCMMSKNIYVDDNVSFNGPDTVCNTAGNFRVIPTPRGGLWLDHPRNWSTSEYIPAGDGSPGWNSIIYEAEGSGCTDTFFYFVKQIFIDQRNLVLCPEALPNQIQIPFNPSIPNGIWSGSSVVDPNQGLIDVSNANDGDRFTFRYTADGCFVDSEINFRSTQVSNLLEDSTFCQNELPIRIRDLIDFNPHYSTFTGEGVEIDSGGDTIFNPARANPGLTELIIEANGCTDTVELRIFGSSDIIEGELCALDDPSYLTFTQNIVNIDGPGILFNDVGLLDPQQANVGVNYYTITSADGCTSLDSVEIVDLVQPQIGILDPFYCFKDTIISPLLNPVGGELFLDDVSISDFNPSELTEGPHRLEYQFGSGNCQARESVVFVTLAPLEVSALASADTVCVGESVRISAEPSGGYLGGSYNITWGSGLGFGQVHYVEPTGPANYIVNLDDGCSDPVRDTLRLNVHPQFSVNLNYDQAVCAYDSSSVRINVAPQSGSYRYETSFGEIDPVYTSLPRNFELLVTDERSNCIQRVSVEMPNHGSVGANFSLYPDDCVDTYDNLIEVNDLSSGHTSLEWILRDSLISDVGINDDLELSFDEAGTYPLKLVVRNDGGCIDSITKEICVKNFFAIQVPNAFSPNGDNVNDEFQFHTIGIVTATWSIYDRYGKMVFQSDDYAGKWDGKIDGNDPESGHYLMVLEYETNNGESDVSKYPIHLVY